MLNDRLDRIFKKGYVWLILLGVSIILVGAFLPPVFAKFGWTGAATVGYWFYRFLCHELPYRSVFLFGLQPVYPLSAAVMSPNQISYERMIDSDGAPLYRVAGSVVGNEFYGYKIALCQRDLAIYLAIIMFCLVFLMSGRTIPRIPVWAWLVFGCVPIGLDGITQMIPVLPLGTRLRESTIFIRIITGFLFGFLTSWLILPTIEKRINNKYFLGKAAYNDVD